LHHRKRCYNSHSDAVANRALDLNTVIAMHQKVDLDSKCRVMLCFDGAARESGACCATGSCLWIFREGREPVCAALLGVPLGQGTNVQAEFVACLFAIYMFCDWLRLYYSASAASHCIFLGAN
jgi:hypothetical protein